MDYKNDVPSDDDFDNSNSYSESFTNNNSNSGYSTSTGQSRASNPNGLSKAELRKTNKPIMEKRRRARINHCLNELKSLILEAMKKDPARHTKLEKADILEMTVKHLQSVQRQQLNMAIQTDPSVIHKFKTGFVECAEEVNRYIGQLEGVDPSVRQRLTNHLLNCATGLEQIGSMTNFNNGYRGQLNTSIAAPNTLFGAAIPNPLAAATATISNPNVASFFPPLPQDLNNNSSPIQPIQMGGVQLIPSRLPSGEFALIMPNANTNPASILNSTGTGTAATFGAPWTAPPASTVTTNAPLLGNATANFQRMSAFSKPPQQQPQQKLVIPNNNNNNNISSITSFTAAQSTATFNQPPPNNLHHHSTTTTSPPLSPISSAASVSSHGDDSIMHTSSDFGASRPATPPHDKDSSTTSQNNFSGVFNTPPPSSAESSLSLSRTSVHLQQQQVSSTSGIDLNASLKRSLSHLADSSDSSDEPSSKKYASADRLKEDACAEERDSMWRPW